MRKKTISMDFFLYEKLKELDSDTNQAIRNLFKMLRNEAVEDEAKFRIEHNTKMLDKNNNELFNLKRTIDEEIATAEKFTNLQLKALNLSVELNRVRLENPKCVIVHYKYEAEESYQKILQEGWKSAIEEITEKINNIQLSLAQAKESKEKMYEERKKILEMQNERCKLEIERANKLLNNAKFLQLENEIS